MRKKILAISPHPDDETLGCGGTIFKHKSMDDEIYWLIVTNISVEEGYDKDVVKERQVEIDTVSKKYGFNETIKLDYPTTKLDVIPRERLINTIRDVIDNLKPELIYVPNRNDVHTDHKITFDAIMSSTKTFRSPFIKKILMYETLSETEFAPPFQNNAFIPNSFSDITSFIEEKINIMEIYKGEMDVHPFPRSKENIKALATFRGAAAGVKFAESFMVLKEIW